MFPNIDFKTGQIAPIESCFDTRKSVEEQVDILREDMFQVHYKSGYTIDVGWYPSFDLDGSFRVFLVYDEDWDNPMEDAIASNYQDLAECVSGMVDSIF